MAAPLHTHLEKAPLLQAGAHETPRTPSLLSLAQEKVLFIHFCFLCFLLGSGHEKLCR